MSETAGTGSTSSGTSDTTSATPDAATTTANTPGPADSPGAPSNPPDAQQAQSTQASQQGAEQEVRGDDDKVDAAYDPSKPVYTGGEEQDKGKRRERDEPEATVEEGNSAEQQPPN